MTEAMNKLLRDTINLILGVTGYAIEAQPDAPRPTGSYGTVRLVSIERQGWEEVINSNAGDNLDQSVQGFHGIRFRLDFFRELAIDNAYKVSLGLASQSIVELFALGLVGLGDRRPILQLTDVVNSKFEDRAQFDVTLHTVGLYGEVLKAISSLDIALVYENNGLTYNSTIEA